MGSLFAIFILVILVVAVLRRRRERREWVRDEVLDDSGSWIDKRAGERGTYGSLDAERERAGQERSRQGRATELAQLVRTFAFEEIPDFHERADDRIKAFNASVRQQAGDMVDTLERIRTGQPLEPAAASAAQHALTPLLKKRLLDFAYAQYPALLDLDLEAIRQLDARATAWATDLLAALDR
jgi:hypothetical protein